MKDLVVLHMTRSLGCCRDYPKTQTLWSEAKPLVNEHGGALVIDDTTLDKPYAAKMGLVTYH